MAVVPSFSGISFENPGYLCFCNSSVNGLLASNIISSKVSQSHCLSCDFLDSRKNDYSLEQSSLILKEWVAYYHPQFDTEDQQCPAEFISCILKQCRILADLTKSEIISTYKCSNCQGHSDDSSLQERFKNILNFNITATSIAEIISKARTDTEPYLKR